MSAAVRAGYKLTDLGVIPNEWDVTDVEVLVKYANGAAHEKSITDFGKYVVVNSKFISTVGEVRKYANECLCPTQVGDVLMVMSDVPNGRAIAKCFYVNEPDTYTVNQRICVLHPIKVDGKLLFYVLNRNKFYLSFDDGAKQTNLRKGDVLSCPIGIPTSEKEQRAIATALSDLDALLTKLDALIAKKRDLKVATMQQLLTGQTRLPGFSGEWEVKRLGAIAEMLKGSGLSKTACEESGRRKCILYGELFTTYGQIISEVFGRTNSSDGRLSVAGDILIPGSTTTEGIDLATASAVLEDGIALGGDINIIRSNEKSKFNAVFYANYLTWTKKREIAERAQGTTIVHLYGRDLGDLLVQCPPLLEQTAMATIISDMDAELTALEARRDKTRALKQGMMQELLTGRIRLV